MRSAPAAAATILLPMLLASCGGGDDDPSSPPPQDAPPTPEALALPPAPFFGSLAPVGRAAEDTVRALLARIDTPTVMHTVLAPVPSLAWTADGVCWSGPDPASGLTYDVCAVDAGWAWEITADPDALLADGETDATGCRGEFAAHEPPADAVTWGWVATASRDSVEWTYARAGETVDLHWSRDDEGAYLWLWTWPGARLVGYRIASSLTTGWCETYAWSADRWILRREVAWDGGHGRWLDFDASGLEISRELW